MSVIVESSNGNLVGPPAFLLGQAMGKVWWFYDGRLTRRYGNGYGAKGGIEAYADVGYLSVKLESAAGFKGIRRSEIEVLRQKIPPLKIEIGPESNLANADGPIPEYYQFTLRAEAEDLGSSNEFSSMAKMLMGAITQESTFE